MVDSNVKMDTQPCLVSLAKIKHKDALMSYLKIMRKLQQEDKQIADEIKNVSFKIIMCRLYERATEY